MSEPYPVGLYPGCPCTRCDSPNWPTSQWGFTFARMTLCPTCGNKRCPGAVDHDRPCSGSNEPGQAGSNYPTNPNPEALASESDVT